MLWPCADGQPTASLNQFASGQRTANFAVLKADAKGELCAKVGANARLIWDQSVVTDVPQATKPARPLRPPISGAVLRRQPRWRSTWTRNVKCA